MEDRDRQFERDRALEPNALREMARNIDEHGLEPIDVIELAYTLAVVREEVNRVRELYENVIEQREAKTPGQRN